MLSESQFAGVASEGSGATVWVRESAVTRNGTGLQQVGAGVLNACGANLLAANGTATAGTINTASCLDVASGSGTVVNVATGAGLAGGPITTSGTIYLAATNLLPTTACAANQIPKWIGSAWACAADNDTNSGGTVTNVATGTGLTGGPIITTGTVSIANGGVGTTQLANSSVDVAKLNTASTDARYFKHGGNAFGAATVLGTTDNQALLLRANGVTSLQIQPTTADPANGFNTATPNLIGGWEVNAAFAGVIGATIGGGGGNLVGVLRFNRVTDHYGTVGGGAGNTAGDAAGTTRDSLYATVGGGYRNAASGSYSTVGGGFVNSGSGGDSTVGGGAGNHASGLRSTVGGGNGNTASGDYSTVAGGLNNEAAGDFSFAAGYRAKALGDGSFSFADSNTFDFSSATANAFRVRATGGVRFVTDIDGTGATTWSCLAVAGAGWACASDRNQKQNLRVLGGQAVLERLAAMPIFEWYPKGRNAHVKHYGPMAQDFHAAFGLGDDDTLIGTQDADGVALAAIQGVNQKVDEQLRARDDEIAALRSSLLELKRTVEMLMAAH